MPFSIHPKITITRVNELTVEMLPSEIDTILLDLDHTITHWKSTEIPPEIVTWVTEMKSRGYKLAIVSNAATHKRSAPVSNALGLPCIINALKPLPFGFLLAMKILQSEKKNTVMVGDQMFTDILGGNMLKLFTVLTTPFSKKEALVTRMIQRPLERLFGRK